jgi:protein-tyrosine phosphatase
MEKSHQIEQKKTSPSYIKRIPVMDGTSSTRTANSVDDNIFISGFAIAQHAPFLLDNGITRVIKLFREKDDDKHIVPGIKYLRINAKDTPTYDLSEHFNICLEFINEGIDNREKILIHCHAGISRSATITLLYLICVQNMPLHVAYNYLKRKRRVIHPNNGFMKQLVDWCYKDLSDDTKSLLLRRTGR